MLGLGKVVRVLGPSRWPWFKVGPNSGQIWSMPGQLQLKSDQRWSNSPRSGRNWLRCGVHRARSGRIRPNLVEYGQRVIEIGPNSIEKGQIRSTPGLILPNLCQIWPAPSRIRSSPCNIWATTGQRWSTSTRFGRFRPTQLAATGPDIGPSRPNLVEPEPKLAVPSGRLWSRSLRFGGDRAMLGLDRAEFVRMEQAEGDVLSKGRPTKLKTMSNLNSN